MSALRPVPFVEYDDRGCILSWGVMAEGAIEFMRTQGRQYICSPGGPDSYVDVSSLTVCMKMPNPARLEGLNIVDVPAGSVVKIGRGPEHTVDDGTAELEFDLPGTYSVQVRSPRHLTKTFEIDYEDPAQG